MSGNGAHASRASAWHLAAVLDPKAIGNSLSLSKLHQPRGGMRGVQVEEVSPFACTTKATATGMEPEALIKWAPGVEGGMVKVAAHEPEESAMTPRTAISSNVNVMPVSLAPNREPTTVTVVPGGPILGLIARKGGGVKASLRRNG